MSVLILLDKGNTLSGSQGGNNMTTRIDLICKGNKKKSKVQKEKAEKNLRQGRCHNVKHVTYHDKEEYILYSNPIVSGYQSKTKRVDYYIGEDGKEYNANTGEVRSDDSIEASLVSSLKRTKKKIHEYILANDWSRGWFLTITLDQKHVNRLNYEECYNRVYQFLKNVKEQNPDFKYIFVPEVHKDECWHFHGLITNCDKLRLIKSGIIQKGREVYNINRRSFKYGNTDATKVTSTEEIIRYMKKRMTKDLLAMAKEKHRYLYSRNLAKPNSETRFVDDMNSMRIVLSESENYVKSKTVSDKVRGGEITYIEHKKGCKK